MTLLSPEDFLLIVVANADGTEPVRFFRYTAKGAEKLARQWLRRGYRVEVHEYQRIAGLAWCSVGLAPCPCDTYPDGCGFEGALENTGAFR